MKPLRNQSLYAVALVAIAAAGLPQVCFALKASGPALTEALTVCGAAKDAVEGEEPTRTACCSKSAGICVICPNPPTFPLTCDVVPHRGDRLAGYRFLSRIEANALRQKLLSPALSNKPRIAAEPATPGVLPNGK